MLTYLQILLWPSSLCTYSLACCEPSHQFFTAISISASIWASHYVYLFLNPLVIHLLYNVAWFIPFLVFWVMLFQKCIYFLRFCLCVSFCRSLVSAVGNNVGWKVCHTLHLYIDWYFFTPDEIFADMIWFWAAPNSPLIFTFNVPVCSNFTSRETNFFWFFLFSSDISVSSCRYLSIFTAVVFLMFVSNRC